MTLEAQASKAGKSNAAVSYRLCVDVRADVAGIRSHDAKEEKFERRILR
jgi:hypothetical protein